jgi:hypothetical protein
VIAGTLVGLCLIAVCRWIGRRDPVAGGIVQTGLALRLWAGLVVFWISYLDLPILSGLHTGGGFWLLASDARTYFSIAAGAAENGLHTVAWGSPSPAFIRLLGLWMSVLGVSPASGLLLNATAYMGIAAIIVAICSRDRSVTGQRAMRLPLFAFSFCPGLLLFSTQALKDQVFCLVLTAGCAAAWLFLTPLASGTAKSFSDRTAGGLVLMGAVIFMVAGIRAYVALIMIGMVSLVLALFAIRRPWKLIPSRLFVSLVLLALFWIPFKSGAEAYYSYYEDQIAGVLGVKSGKQTGFEAIAIAREGFSEAGGATNVSKRQKPLNADAGWLERAGRQAQELTVGLSLLFVPVSLLSWTSVVNMQGGRGLLGVTDIDTLFLDFTIVAIGLFMVRAWWPERANLAYFVFTLGLSLVLTVLMAYVVTNFGTIFRLRVIAIMILWLLPLAAITGAADSQRRQSSRESVRENEAAFAAL